MSCVRGQAGPLLRAIALTAALVFASADAVQAYKVNCGDAGPFAPSQLTSVFAEARKEGCRTGTACDPDRFHSGVDVSSGCQNTKNVRPVLAGVFYPSSNACSATSSSCVRVISTATGQAFDYIHLEISTALIPGQWVTTSTVLGTIDSESVLHLNDLIKMGQAYIRVNPQFQGRLEYSDPDRPQFSTATIGNISEKEIILIRDGTQNSPQSFLYRDFRYFVRGDVDILATARNGSKRKGLYLVGSNANPITNHHTSLRFPAERTLEFGFLLDGGVSTEIIKTVYYYRQANADTFNLSNEFFGPTAPQAADRTWATEFVSDGAYNLCVFLQDHPPSPGANTNFTCDGAWIDNSKPAIQMSNGGGAVADGGATSTRSITIDASDAGGLYSIQLVGGVVYSSTAYMSGVDTAESIQFPTTGVLDDGAYVARVTDLAGNQRATAFVVKTSTPDPTAKAGSDDAQSTTDPLTENNCIVLKATEDIVEMWSPIITSTAVFDADVSTMVFVTLACGLPPGDYDIFAKDLAGNIGKKTVHISSAGYQMIVSGAGQGWSQSSGVNIANIGGFELRFGATSGLTTCSSLSVKVNGGDIACTPQCPGCQVDYTTTTAPQAKTITWSATNTSAVSSFTSTLQIGAEIGPIGVPGYATSITFNAAPHPYVIPPGGSISGQVYIPETPRTNYVSVVYGSTLAVTSPYNGVILSTRAAFTGAEEIARLKQVLRQSGHIVDITADGGMAVFNSTMALSFAYADPIADTTTAKIYRLKNSIWESASISSQVISRNGNDVFAIGLTTYTATFVVFFDGHDSSAPVTSFELRGSSFNFDQALFVSTDAFLVFTATDPAVSGYASTVASTTYRIDPDSGTPFSIFASSFPLPIGTHVIEYRSIDYAGNIEPTKTTTFTVTAGSAFRTTSTGKIPGNLLGGYLGGNTKAEIVSAGQNAYTLLISSANRQPLVFVDNMGEVGIGAAPQSNINLGQSAFGLQVRSGNSTSTVTSNQISLGYNGDYSMAHLLRTEHSTSTDGNKMDFLVWNPGAGSTTTAANLNVLSLQGITAASNGSFHVHPFGEPDTEVEVSDGLSTGGGTIQRLQLLMPSSRRFKTDVRDLGDKDERQALKDVLALRHAKYFYTNSTKPHAGLVYEETPASVQDGSNSVSTTERLVNVEMALKTSISRLEELRKRYAALKAKGRNP